MFKNCCGCKTPTEKKQIGEKEKDEAYSKSSSKADGNPKAVSPSKVVPKEDSGPVSSAPPKPPPQPEKAKSPAAPAPALARAPKLSIQGPDDPAATALPSEEPAAKANDEETLTKESTPSKSGSVAATTATVASGAEDLSADGDGSKPASPEPDTCDAETAAATLRAFAHGMLHTPHPSKRSGSVPGLGSLPQWLSQEDDDDDVFREGGGTTEPPATPVGRDELALRRHRFFSDLLQAHQAATEHRVRFDPLGPIVAGGFEYEQRTPTVEFETLLNRLEKVTTRLERTVSATEEALQKQAGLQNSNEQIVPLESALKESSPKVVSVETKSAEAEKFIEEKPIVLQDPPKSSQEKQGISSTDSVSNMSVPAFQEILNGPLASFLSTSAQIGDDVAAVAQLVKQAFQAQLQYLSLAASSGPPSMDQNMKLLEPTSTQIRAIQDFREKHRGSQQFNHLSAVSESIAALGWVTVSPAPAPFVKEMNDAGQFYTNRVLKEWKEKDKKHKVWVDAWVETLSELQKFVKQYHTTGLVWGGKGSPPSAPAGVPPPPPPGLPPPPPEMPLGDLPPGSDAQDRSALFAEINRGEAITSTLKKVTPDMQTHKNPTLRSGPAPFKAPVHTNTYRSVTAPGQVVDKPPNFTKEGKKWLVEYHKGNQNLLIDQTEMNNVIYMYKCVESTLTVKGKVNSVVLDSCRKSSVVFDSVVSSVEFVNCQSVQMQVINKVPTISIDKTDGCQMYLSPESLEVEIVSAKSSEMNVMVPKANGEYSEYPVPEQFKTTLSPKGLLTVAVENKGPSWKYFS
ncbi:Adenylyl cyclase-associated protein, partial [Gryllus bimaculatus]